MSFVAEESLFAGFVVDVVDVGALSGHPSFDPIDSMSSSSESRFVPLSEAAADSCDAEDGVALPFGGLQEKQISSLSGQLYHKNARHKYKAFVR